MSNELVKVMNNQVVVSSLDIAEHFEKQHKNVLQTIENLAAQNSAAKSFFYEDVYDNRGKQYRHYLMNRDGFSLLVMGFTGSQALQWKVEYIKAFNEMEERLRNTNCISLPNFSDPVAAARAWADEKEKAIIVEQRLAIAQPKADYLDLIMSTTNGMNVTAIAKDYGMSAKAFNAMLHEYRVQYKNGNMWVLYAPYSNKGYTVSNTIHANGEAHILTRWTQKGRRFLYELLKDEGVLPLMEQENIE